MCMCVCVCERERERGRLQGPFLRLFRATAYRRAALPARPGGGWEDAAGGLQVRAAACRACAGSPAESAPNLRISELLRSPNLRISEPLGLQRVCACANFGAATAAARCRRQLPWPLLSHPVLNALVFIPIISMLLSLCCNILSLSLFYYYDDRYDHYDDDYRTRLICGLPCMHTCGERLPCCYAVITIL